MNNDDREDRNLGAAPSGEVRRTTGRHALPEDHPSEAEPPTVGQRRAIPPDDRLTTIIPAVTDQYPGVIGDPVEAARAALESPPPRHYDLISPDPFARAKIPTSAPDQVGPVGPATPPGSLWDAARTKAGAFSTEAARSVLEALKARRLHLNWRLVRRVSFLLVVVMVLIPVVTFGMAYAIVDIPKASDIRTNQISTILAADGSELAEIVPPEGNRVDVNISEVPVHVRQAVIAAEDRNFYSNLGFDPSGFARAVENNLLGSGDLQGGSTITQQYVKNALVGSAQHGIAGLVRKAKELVIATKMASTWSKDQVLQSYLNIIYFGRGAYGISAASKAYFGKSVDQLSVAEGALLAALIRRPSSLDPAVDLPGATARWNWVLDGMVQTKALSAEDRAAQVFPNTLPPEEARAKNQTKGPTGLIERQVTRELMQLFKVDEQALNTQGLRITTTIDPKAQHAAEAAVKKYLQGEDPDMRTAVVSIDPRDGGIKAYYAGSDANGYDFAQAGLQTGSSFKVFALTAALEQGIGLGFPIDSSPLELNGIKIANVDGEACGECNIAEALKLSLNTSYYRLMLKLKGGPQAVADAAHQAGIATSFPGVAHTLSEDGQGGPPSNGIVLGQYQTRPVDMASAYATLAASGVYHRPHMVTKVVNGDGQVLYEEGADSGGDRRIPKAVADNVTAAMEPIAAYSRGHNLAGGRLSAAKTGTVQFGDTKSNKDAWMVGYTPSLSTAVWVGTAKGDKPLVTSSGAEVYGSGLPSDIWKATMDGALKGTANEPFPKPTEIGGFAGVPVAPPPPPPAPTVTVIQPTIEIAPGITIPLGPPQTITVEPPPPAGPGSPASPPPPGQP